MLMYVLRFYLTRWRANPRLLAALHSPSFEADSGPLWVAQ